MGSDGEFYVKQSLNNYFMGPRCECEHWKVQEAEAKQMLLDYLIIPEDYMLHPKR